MFEARWSLDKFKLFFIGLSLICLAGAAGAAEPSPVGLWKTIDDRSHKPRGLIRLYERNGELFGRIEASEDPKEAAEVCSKCSGDRKNKPIIGLEVLRDMKRHGSDYEGGYIVDPESGWVYRCKISVEDGGKKLLVRGYVGISLLGRTQTWLRQE